ncbi:MAG: Ig-like domain-containing protein [Steroidobacteraceae bacterium]
MLAALTIAVGLQAVLTAAALAADLAPPTAPSGLTAAASGGQRINLNWIASTDNIGVSRYWVERCTGAGCTNFAQLATPTTTTFSNTGLTNATTYTYRVRASDAAGNLSSYSNVSSATTADTQAPTSPSGLKAAAVAANQIDLSWTASVDNVAVTQYLVERCQGAGCTSFRQVATSTGTAFSSAGLSTGLSYRHRVRATDAAGNRSGYSNVASATTPDVQAPTVPGGLAATAIGANQINLSWMASSDNVGVTGYRIYRGAVQIGTSATRFYSDNALSPSTTYTYAVSAFDAAGNNSTASNPASATTSAPFDFTLSNEGEKSVIQGFSTSNAISAILSSGTTAAVSYTVSGAPLNALVSFSSSSCNPSCTSVLTIKTTGLTPTGVSPMTVTGTGGSVIRATSFTLTVVPDTVAPSVSLTAPLHGAVVAGITTAVAATASDNVGVAGVQFFLNGSALGAEITTSPYAITWDTTVVPNGSYALTAAARDTSNNFATSSPATVMVNNLPVVITVEKGGDGTGTVAGGPINCGTACAATVNSGDVVTLVASPAALSLFSGWSSGCSGVALSCTLAVNAATTVRADFTLEASAGGVKLTDFVDMENGPDGAVLTPAIANNDSQLATGRSGFWENGPGGAPLQLYVSKSSGLVSPPRGPVQIGRTLIGDNGSRGMYRKHADREYDLLSYTLSPTRPKVAVGLYMQFTGGGWALNPWHYYDVFDVTAVSGDFITFNMISGSPLVFQIETYACSSGVPVVNGVINKWYWVTMIWDQPNRLATMAIYDPANWTRLGSGSCPVDDSPLSAIWIGDTSQHGNPPIDGDYYMDDLMVDTSGAHGPSNPLLPASAMALLRPDTVPPASPTNLTATPDSSAPAIYLRWTASVDDVGVASYRVFRCEASGCTPSVEVARTTVPSFQDGWRVNGPRPATTYTYAVSALDGSGNESGLSSRVSAATK